MGLALLSLVGCATSAADTAKARLSTVQSKPKAYVRVLNLLDEPVDATLRGMPLTIKLPSGECSPFLITAAGKQKLTAKSGEKSLYEGEQELGGGAGTTMILGPKVTWAKDEPRSAEAGSAAVLVVNCASGNPTLEVDGKKLDPSDKPLSLSSGSHSVRVSVNGRSAAQSIDLDDAHGYSLFVIQKGNEISLKLSGNTPESRPAGMAGNSAA